MENEFLDKIMYSLPEGWKQEYATEDLSKILIQVPNGDKLTVIED